MLFKEKVMDNWQKDLWQAIGEQDVLMLRIQLRLNQNLLNENLRNYAMNTTENITI